MAGLQANQHFLLPAAAPIIYNIGQIFGAIFLAPDKGYVIKGFTLPAMGFGVYGLVYGVIIGALLHLLIQVPALIKYKFHWIPSFGFDNPAVRKVLMMMGPRVVNILFVQLVFIVRDNLASRLQQGAVSALTYGWMIQQVPETLIGTAIGTALLPTLSELVARDERDQFKEKIERAIKTLIAVTLPVAVILALGLQPFIGFVFKFNDSQTSLMMWVTRGYLVGLAGHCILEIGARSFFARQNAVIPLLGSALNVVIYIVAGSLLFRPLGAAGVSLTDSIAFTAQAIFILVLLNRRIPSPFSFTNTTVRAMAAAAVSGGVVLGIQYLFGKGLNPLLPGIISMAIGLAVALPFIWKEFRLLVRL
jgi:putative peptidoglycan lipid II flippase